MKQETKKPRLFMMSGCWYCSGGMAKMTFGRTPKLAYDWWAFEQRNWESYVASLDRQSRPQSLWAWLFDDFIEEVEVETKPQMRPRDSWKAFKAIYARANPIAQKQGTP